MFASDPPELRGHADALDMAYDEYGAPARGRRALSVSTFVAEFPAELQNSVRKFVAAHEFLRSPEYTAEEPNEFAWPEPGETVDGLKVQRELGRGGFGRVYLVWDNDLNRHDVVKLTLGSTEARLAGPLDHPNIVRIHSARMLPGGVSCIRMPLLGCATLAHVMADAFSGPGRPLPPTWPRAAAPGSRESIRAGDRALPDTRTYFAAALTVAARLAHGVAFRTGRESGTAT